MFVLCNGGFADLDTFKEPGEEGGGGDDGFGNRGLRGEVFENTWVELVIAEVYPELGGGNT